MASRRRDFVAREIERAGIELFATAGYENVTVAEIAAAAGVSRRTFFRYFASKAEVVHAFDVRLARRVVHALERRPAKETAAVALCNAIVDSAQMEPDEERSALLGNRLILETHSTTFFGGRESNDRMIAMVAERLGTEPGADVRAELIVLTALAAARAGTRAWSNNGADRPLTTYLRDYFDYVLTGLAELA